MVSKIDLFKPIVLSLLKTSAIEEEVFIAQSLEDIFNGFLNSNTENQPFVNTESTSIETGIALSSKQALDCLKDPLRTTRFIRGTYMAIQKSFCLFPNEKIEIVYAGCGPIAPIIIPLLSIFTSDQVSITLLDIHKSSIDSVSELTRELGVDEYFRSIRLTDATKYEHPKNIPLHIVLSETMDKGLTKEPQVAITQNLAPQLIDKGIYIPESINIFLEHSFFSKEPYFDIYKNVVEHCSEIIIENRQTLFTITKEINNQTEFEFVSPIIEIPHDFQEIPDICIYAEIQIFESQRLLKSQSLITNPICIASIYSLAKPYYELKYLIKDIPKWYILEKD